MLSVRLFRAANGKPIPEQVVAALVDMHAAAERLRLAVRGRLNQPIMTRVVADRRLDGAWFGVHKRLEAWSRQVGEPEAVRADQVIAKVFPKGLAFTLERHEAEWVHSRELLGLIEEQKLDAEINELAGPRFLELVRSAHVSMGEALGLEGKSDDEELAIGEELTALTVAIARYGRVFAGTVMDDEDLEVFVLAMKPLEELRQRLRQERPSVTGEAAELEAAELEAAAELEEENFDFDQPLPPLLGGSAEAS